jgi:Domain of unknown function (DUF6438)
MNWLFKYLLLIFVLVSCKQKNNINYPSLIKGDWISKTTQPDSPKKPLVFSFEDSVSSINNPLYDYTKYHINENILTVQPDTLFYPQAIEKKFYISFVDRDSLKLSPIFSNEHKSETIRFEKLKAKNSFVVKEIYFLSSGCFGTCPSMLLKIDSSRRLFFLGRSHTEIKGSYYGVINKSMYKSLIDKIQHLPIDSLQLKYEAGWTDDQICGVKIVAANKTIISSAYGYDKEPVELRILFTYLMNLYKYSNLKKDIFLKKKTLKKTKGLRILLSIDLLNQKDLL